MEWLLRRNYWLVKLLAALTITAFTANTATTLLGFWLLSGATSSSAPQAVEDGEDEDDAEDGATLAATHAAAVPRNNRARRAERNAERILGYSPFCPTCGPTPAAEAPDGQPLPPLDAAEAELAGAQRSTLPLVVAATMEAEDPAHSLATLVDTTHGVGGLFGVGDKLGPNVEILRVATGVVHIRNAGKLEYIPFDALPVAPAPKPAKPDAKDKEGEKPAATDRTIPGAEEAIQCSGKGDCVVDRAFVEQLIAQPKLLMGQGGASPATTKDGSSGFKLRGVKKGTLPDLLGLKNGDVITEVGGAPLTMDMLPGLYGKLRHASHVEVTVDRRGERMTRQLEIRS